jgi:hypothetical protein
MNSLHVVIDEIKSNDTRRAQVTVVLTFGALIEVVKGALGAQRANVACVIDE